MYSVEAAVLTLNYCKRRLNPKVLAPIYTPQRPPFIDISRLGTVSGIHLQDLLTPHSPPVVPFLD